MAGLCMHLFVNIKYNFVGWVTELNSGELYGLIDPPLSVTGVLK